MQTVPTTDLNPSKNRNKVVHNKVKFCAIEPVSVYTVANTFGSDTLQGTLDTTHLILTGCREVEYCPHFQKKQPTQTGRQPAPNPEFSHYS